MKKLTILFALLTLSVGVWAQKTIDGVKYLDAKGVEQTVNGVNVVKADYSGVDTWGEAGQTTWYLVILLSDKN